MLTHGALRANIEMLLSLSDPPAVVDSDVVLLVLPMFHVYGLNTGLGLAIAAGATCVINDRFDPVESLQLIATHRVTTVAGAPAMYQAWCATPGVREAMGTVRLLSSGGAPLPPRVFAQFAELTGLEIFEGYGMTETAPVIATTLVSGTAKAGLGRPAAAGPGDPPRRRVRCGRGRGRSGRDVGPRSVGLPGLLAGRRGRSGRAGLVPVGRRGLCG